MKKRVLLSVVLATGILLSACGGKAIDLNTAEDGLYSASYQDDGDNPSRVEVKFTIDKGKVIQCEATEFDAKGRAKDEHYGEQAGPDNFAKAQRALEGIRQYPQLLTQVEKLEDLDAVSGATVSHKRFVEAIKKALRREE